MARIAVLEAAVRTGNVHSASEASSDRPSFLSKLEGEDLIAATTVLKENEDLKAQVAQLEDTVRQRDYRILHMKKGIELAFPAGK